MMIPKNRDNSGPALLYIVGPVFVRPCFVGPTIALQPRRWTIAPSADGCKRLLGRPLYSAQLEDCRFVLLVESDDVFVMTPQ